MLPLSFSGSNTDSGSTGGPQGASNVPVFMKQIAIGQGNDLGSDLAATASASPSMGGSSSGSVAGAASWVGYAIVGGAVLLAAVVIVLKKN